MHISSTFLVATLATAAAALPGPLELFARVAAPSSCPNANPAVQSAVQSLQASSQGQAYCASYLSISTKTVTSTIPASPTTRTVTDYSTVIRHTGRSKKHITKTRTTSTTTTSTLTLGASATASSNAPVQTKTTTTTVFNTVTMCSFASGSAIPSSSQANFARAITSSVTEPAPLSTLNPSEQSQACSCVVTTPTSTTTITKGKPSTVKTTITKANTIRRPATVTTTVTDTNTITNTKTVTSVHKGTTTTTVTKSATTTVNSCAQPSSCNNHGLQYAAFHNPEGDNDNDGYPNYEPTYMYAASAGGQGPSQIYYNDTTSSIGPVINNCGGGQISVYGHSSIQCQYFSLNHRGYLYASTTGTYTFELFNIDDIAILWTGSNAKTGWNRGNANLIVTFNLGVGTGSGSTSLHLQQGEYLPIRVVLGNGQLGVGFKFAVTAPDGKYYIGPATSDSPFLLQNSCDGTAPPFPYQFGYEQ